MAVTEQQFIEQYSQLSADKQQKMYNAGNSQVKQWIDNYNNTQVKPQNIQSNNGNNNMNTNTNNNMVSNNNVNDKIVSNSSNLNNQGNLSNQNRQTFNYTDADYYTLGSQARQNDIVNNLNNYRQTNPEYFTDYENFKKNFSYNDRSDVQKQTLDTWYNGYQRGMELNSKTVSDLATQYKNGLISDSDLEQLRTANQGKYREVMNYINKQTILSKYDEENTPSASANPFQGIIDQYYNNLLTASQTNASSEMFDNYKNQMNSPEMTEMSDQLADLDGQLKEYQNELNRIKSDVERRYEGTGASKSKINAIIADESYKIQEAMNTASLQYNTLATKYNNRMTQYQNEFQLQLQEYQFNMQQRNQQMQELGFVMDLMNFETNEQKDEREWNNYVRQYDFQYGNINSKDEASRRRAIENAVDSVLTEFSGITMMRSREQMVEDIKNLVDGGMSLGEAITKNIREPIMQKDEYTARQASRYGGTQSGRNSFTVGDMSYTIGKDGKVNYSGVAGKTSGGLSYNMVTEADKQNGMNSYINSIQSMIDNHDKIRSGGCGTVCNDYLDAIGAGVHYDNYKSTKLNSKNSDTATIGSIAIWENTGTKAGNEYGHVAIVTNVDNTNGTITVLESNEGTGLRYNTYSQSKVYGYFDPSKGSSSANGSSTGGLTERQATEKASALAAIKAGSMTPSDTSKRLSISAEQGWGDEFQEAVSSSKATQEVNTLRKEFNNLQEVKDYKDAEANYNKIKTSADGTAAGDLSLIFAYMKMLDPGSVVREGEFANAQNAAGIPEKIMNAYNNAIKGTRLSDKQRKEFVSMAKSLYQNYADTYNKRLEEFQSYITLGGNPNNIGTPAGSTVSTNTSNNKPTGFLFTGLGGTGTVINTGTTVNGINVNSLFH